MATGTLSISVCMATHNGSRFLREQLESILPQLAPGDELVVSDDASTDDTLAILASYADPRLKVLAGNVFHSPVRNFENALRHARGAILVLCDQDDVWLPGRLDLVRERLGRNDDRVALLMMDGDLVDAGGNPLGVTIFERNRVGTGLLKNIYDNTYTGCCLGFSRALLDMALPFPDKLPMHDMWLGLLAELFGQVEFLPARTILHRRHGENASFRATNRLLQIRRRIRLVLCLAARCVRIVCLRRLITGSQKGP